MEIETFECQETCNETIEQSAEAVELIEKLGLEGQRGLAVDGNNRVPYEEMTELEWKVYSLICPRSCKLTEYDRSPIPLRVLQVAAHAQSLEYFSHLVVHCAEPIKDPDPILLGLVGSDYNPSKRYLLARWGDTLTNFQGLMVKAAEIHKGKISDVLAKIAASANVLEQRMSAKFSPEQILGLKVPAYYD